MTIAALENITITDHDIDEIEMLLGDISFDEHRRRIIKELSTFDVQAFPGSGKTTVLIAKLAILAKKWPYENKGICVLSHTNVARDEIERRLGQTDIGKKLLSYPHFIGTLHSFCDTYISIPWLRSNGYPISLIDTDIVVKRRWEMLRYTTHNYIHNKCRTEYTCQSIGFPVSIDIGCAETTDSYKDVKRVVEQSQKNGYFTFDEMLYITKHVVSECSTICIAIQNRFPIMFIDEAQDTSDFQWDIISSVFNDDDISIKQAFGDANQAIFQSYNSEDNKRSFPINAKVMTMPNSHRFGASIAKLADPLAILQKGLIGESTAYEKNNNQHTIFLFNKNDTDALLQSYAKHVLNCFSDEELEKNKRLGCYVVGMVHKSEPESTDSKRFPVGIRDYYADYDPGADKAKEKPKGLIDYFRAGANKLEQTKDFFHYIDSICSAFRQIINENTSDNISTTTKAFNALLRSLPADKQVRFRRAILLLSKLPLSCETEWNSVLTMCKKILKFFWNITTTSPLQSSWTEFCCREKEEKIDETSFKRNIYTYVDEDSSRSINIQFASIHSVKGRTHLSTMVVETFWYKPNIKSLLSCLCNQPFGKIGVRDEIRMKCHYVALTRARGLICVALPKEYVSKGDAKLMRENGWNIIEI